jgi:hypothetical protein
MLLFLADEVLIAHCFADVFALAQRRPSSLDIL